MKATVVADHIVTLLMIAFLRVIAGVTGVESCSVDSV
jgi:hypothetical protein